MDDCVFCKIVNGIISSTIIYQDEQYLAFMDVMPAVKGHVLVITKQHYGTFLDISEEEVSGLAAVVYRVGNAVVKATSATGFKIETFGGKIAGQSVSHVHFHVIPRYVDDGLVCRADVNWWEQRKSLYKEGEMEQLADRIRSYLK